MTILPDVQVFDNGGKTWDRYTVVIDSDVFGMSVNASSPSGFNQWSGTLAENTAVLEVVNGAKNKMIGKSVALTDLPNEVKGAIADRLKTYMVDDDPNGLGDE